MDIIPNTVDLMAITPNAVELTARGGPIPDLALTDNRLLNK